MDGDFKDFDEFESFLQTEPDPVEDDIMLLGRSDEWLEGFKAGYLIGMRDSNWAYEQALKKHFKDKKG